MLCQEITQSLNLLLEGKANLDYRDVYFKFVSNSFEFLSWYQYQLKL